MRKYEFGEFELDLDAVQLRHRGQPVRLERRPLDLLILLVERHGQLVSRDDIIAALWPERVIIDFESGLNTLVRKVRNALGDASDEPRFIETVPGRGYRFIAQVRPVTVAESPQTTNSRRRAAHPVTAVVVVLLLAAGVVGIGRYFMAEPEQIRIAILPFDNLTGDANLGYIASGLAEETNTSLAQIDLPNLSVIGVVSTTAVAGSDLPLSAIGRQLGADFVVKSSLRLERSRIRVTSRLLRVDDGEQLWSASFDRELTNLLGLQRELSIAIAEQVRQTLSPDIAAAIDRRQTQNPEAYSLYLRGRHAWMQFQPDSVPRALNYYRQAVELDPTYALAWAGLAHTLITSTATIDASRNSVLSTAYEALQKALDYGPDLAESQLALGSFYLFLESDVVAAEAAARRAIALDPNSAMSHMFLGITLAQADNPLEARAMMRRAREL
ncbi:MAG: winged helix-turn-helix domain-containing protein, partial [Woeseiaceae bacterium]|nr:winged helix-turn-helix domain-containing protein [Woeseiaceae bacterium]